MSVHGTAALGTAGVDPGSRRSWISVVVGLVLLALAAALVASGLLVRLRNDRDHLSLLPASVAPGESVSGELTLTNTGLLPEELALEARSVGGPAFSPSPGLTLTLVRTGDGRVLYEGPLGRASGGLMTLASGSAVHLRLSVRAENRGQGTEIPLPYDYYWTARAAIPWWWWIAAVLLVSLVVTIGYWRPQGWPGRGS